MPADSVQGVVARNALGWYRDTRNTVRRAEKQTAQDGRQGRQGGAALGDGGAVGADQGRFR